MKKNRGWADIHGMMLLIQAVKCVVVFMAVSFLMLLSGCITLSIASGTENQPSNETYELSVKQGNADGIDSIKTSVDLYKIADISTFQGKDGMSVSYSVNDVFKDADFRGHRLSDILQDSMDDDLWHEAAQAATHAIFTTDSNGIINQRISPNRTVEMLKQKALFGKTEPGLYLIITRKTSNSPQAYISVASNGDILTKASSGNYRYTWMPSMVCVYENTEATLKPSSEKIPQPSKPEDPDKPDNPQPDTGYSNLSITKKLLAHDGQKIEFRFTADVYASKKDYQNGTNRLMSIPVTIPFNATGEKTVQASFTIPANSYIVVYESKADRGYRLMEASYSMKYGSGNWSSNKAGDDGILLIDSIGKGNNINAVFINGYTDAGTPVPGNPSTVTLGDKTPVRTGDDFTIILIVSGMGILLFLILIVKRHSIFKQK